LEIVEHSHSEPNRFRGLTGGEIVDDRIFDNYGRLVPGPVASSSQGMQGHEIMMGKLKPRNIDFFEFPPVAH
jgi:hypothetical protein